VIKILSYIFLVVILANYKPVFAQNNSGRIDLTITNIRNNKGNIIISIYKSENDFEKRTFYKKIYISKTKLKNGTLKYKFNLPPHIYGIAIVDDENCNKKIDGNFFGIPKEGFGFSNYYHTSLSMPKFPSFKFELKNNTILKVNIKVRYL
jgi:uncharacterized protein (DUF2141 family)